MMFEDVLSWDSSALASQLKDNVRGFYLAGGTGLALQLGHRKSEDLDFFSANPFNTQELSDSIRPEKISSIHRDTFHCIKNGIKLSFIFYDVGLIRETVLWNGITVAAWEDIVAEKFKTISQRGAKKDFYDLYAAINLKANIPDVCSYFLQRFNDRGINLYHILKSLVFFQDAEEEPDPIMTARGKEWEWVDIKKFFETHIIEFENCILSIK